MSTYIKFGTSGWRAIIAEEFTVANVRRAVTGIAEYVAGKNPNRRTVLLWGEIPDIWVSVLSILLLKFLALPG